MVRPFHVRHRVSFLAPGSIEVGILLGIPHRSLWLVPDLVGAGVAARLELLDVLDGGAAGAAEADHEVGAPAALDAVLLADLATLEAAEAVTIRQLGRLSFGEKDKNDTYIIPQPPHMLRAHHPIPHAPHALGFRSLGSSIRSCVLLTTR